MNIKITHLYPQNLNLYGDNGNILALKRRCEWRGIEVEIKPLNIADNHKSGKTDIYFMGGGQDQDQLDVVEDFHKLKKEAIEKDIDNNIVFLGVCGGYQLMGHTFLMGDGKVTPGLGIIDVETRAPSKEVKERCIGNLIAKINSEDYVIMKNIYPTDSNLPKTLVGFENHTGRTFITDESVRPFATTINGFGNNYSREQEGARYKNVFGSYMHGSFLPKNPHIADYLIWLALINKYDKDIKLAKLNDTIELQAHQYIIDKYGK